MTEAAWDIAQATKEAVLDLALSDQFIVDPFRSSNGGRMVRISAHRDLLGLVGRALDDAASNRDLAGPTRACARRSGRDVWGQITSIDLDESPEARRHRLALELGCERF